MSDITIIINTIFIISGSIFLILSLPPIRTITKELSTGKLKLKWNILSVLVVFFFIGYLYFAFDYVKNSNNSESIDHIVPLIFFLGGVFVFLVGSLASQTAINMKEIATLQHECNTDSLMQINNRRYFDKKIEDEVNISSRYSLPLSLLMLDIDFFKNINDTYGHVVGDSVLREIAEIIKCVARDSDIIARYGGEEIAIIATNTNYENATVLAERLRKIIEQSTFKQCCANEEDFRISISIGISYLHPQKNTSSKELVVEADKALYKAKDSGRNRVVLAEIQA